MIEQIVTGGWSLLTNELSVDRNTLISVLNYDGVPIPAQTITAQILLAPHAMMSRVRPNSVTVLLLPTIGHEATARRPKRVALPRHRMWSRQYPVLPLGGPALRWAVEPHKVATLRHRMFFQDSGLFLVKSRFQYRPRSYALCSSGANLTTEISSTLVYPNDGDTASIGMGQFVRQHCDANLNMLYIVMNNGCYGLTKVRTVPLPPRGSKRTGGSVNPFESIDLCG
ncbi:MAG: hypothetical protein IPM83_16630 [Ignavibacteria bacterium]|nr:hypothetical protein [Ignavibacteria bacterium]